MHDGEEDEQKPVFFNAKIVLPNLANLLSISALVHFKFAFVVSQNNVAESLNECSDSIFVRMENDTQISVNITAGPIEKQTIHFGDFFLPLNGGRLQLLASAGVGIDIPSYDDPQSLNNGVIKRRQIMSHCMLQGQGGAGAFMEQLPWVLAGFVTGRFPVSSGNPSVDNMMAIIHSILLIVKWFR